jgi:hypothetical protein
MLHLLSLLIYVSFKRLELVGVTYIGDIRCGSERSQISRSLLFMSTLKLARNFAFASWISCSLCSLNWSCSSTDKVSQVGSMILLGRRQSYPLNRPLRADLICLYVMSPAESPKKCVGADTGANHYDDNRRRCSLHRRERSATRGRTVRDLAQGSGSLPDGSDGPRL